MTPPEALGPHDDAAPDTPQAVLSCAPVISILAQRADFLRAASAKRQSTPGFTLQARNRGDANDMMRIGFTCSKKIGNAVARNRAKRRLREVARAVLYAGGQRGWDYVVVGRPGATITRDFADLLGDMRFALSRLHGAAT